jgi:hypothetical protein
LARGTDFDAGFGGVAGFVATPGLVGAAAAAVATVFAAAGLAAAGLAAGFTGCGFFSGSFAVGMMRSPGLSTSPR